MKEAENTHDLSRADYNRKITKAAGKAARWALEAEEESNYDIDQATGDAMNDVWGDDFRTHRGRILDYASMLPENLDKIHDIYGPESTGELLDYIAREALYEDIWMLAWRMEEFGNDIRRMENELREERGSIQADAE